MRGVISGRSRTAEFEEECTSSITSTADKTGVKSDMIFSARLGQPLLPLLLIRPVLKVT